MLSKEEIEKVKELKNMLDYARDCKFANLQIDNKSSGLLYLYINQLESDKQNLIEKLEKDKYTIESTYSQINGDYFMAQDKLDYIKEILAILKGENHEQ